MTRRATAQRGVVEFILTVAIIAAVASLVFWATCSGFELDLSPPDDGTEVDEEWDEDWDDDDAWGDDDDDDDGALVVRFLIAIEALDHGDGDDDDDDSAPDDDDSAPDDDDSAPDDDDDSAPDEAQLVQVTVSVEYSREWAPAVFCTREWVAAARQAATAAEPLAWCPRCETRVEVDPDTVVDADGGGDCDLSEEMDGLGRLVMTPPADDSVGGDLLEFGLLPVERMAEYDYRLGVDGAWDYDATIAWGEELGLYAKAVGVLDATEDSLGGAIGAEEAFEPMGAEGSYGWFLLGTTDEEPDVLQGPAVSVILFYGQ